MNEELLNDIGMNMKEIEELYYKVLEKVNRYASERIHTEYDFIKKFLTSSELPHIIEEPEDAIEQYDYYLCKFYEILLEWIIITEDINVNIDIPELANDICGGTLTFKEAIEQIKEQQIDSEILYDEILE